MTGLESQSTVYKELRLRQVLKSKENIQSVQNVFESEYLNLVGLIKECEKRKLVHISSSVPLLGEKAKFIQVISFDEF